MKKGIHPKYVEATVKCACGNTFETRATQETIETEICSQCHPLFTGEEILIDTAGQVEKFKQRLSKAKKMKKEQKKTKKKTQAKKEKKEVKEESSKPDNNEEEKKE